MLFFSLPARINPQPTPPLPTSLDAAATAINAAQAGQLDFAQAVGLHDNLLYPWIEFALLQHFITTVDPRQAQAFLSAQTDEPVQDLFRTIWLKELARRQAWPLFVSDWTPQNDVSLQCAFETAEIALGHVDQQWIERVSALWQTNIKPLPSQCDVVLATLEAHHGIDEASRWRRIERAAEGQSAETMRTTAQGLEPTARLLANSYADFIQTHALAAWKRWPKTPRSRWIATVGLSQWAHQDPDAAEKGLAIYAPALGLEAPDRQRVLYQIAYWSAASYLPRSAERLATVAERNDDDKLRVLRVREALARNDWGAALQAIEKMPTAQRDDERWQYFRARLLDKTGHSAQATDLYGNIASHTSYYGFLAADHIHRPYILCPSPALTQPLATRQQQRWLARALALFQIKRPIWADLEWAKMVKGLTLGQRQSVAEMASQIGWYDRAIRTLSQANDLQRYDLRFPLGYQETVLAQTSANHLDAAWVLAEIRAESMFNPWAQSAANARGLLQLLPTTAGHLAAEKGMAGYKGPDSLYDPSVNIELGSTYLASLLKTFKLPYAAIAAYNAGPTAAQRWLTQRPDQDADLWIESISYQETREYVARILAFSVLYDWRLHHSGLTITARLAGLWNSPRQAYLCPRAEKNQSIDPHLRTFSR